MINKLIIVTEIEEFELPGEKCFDLLCIKFDGEKDFEITRIDYEDNDVKLIISPTSETLSLSRLNRELFIRKKETEFYEKVIDFKYFRNMDNLTFYQDANSKWNKI